jgi:hypothetical protein
MVAFDEAWNTAEQLIKLADYLVFTSTLEKDISVISRRNFQLDITPELESWVVALRA